VARGGHAVRIYASVDELVATVVPFLADGLAAGEPAVVIARRAHLDPIEAALAEHRFAPALLVTAEADDTLAAITSEAGIARDDFERVVGGMLDLVTAEVPGRTPRVFGEMVDVLVERGETGTAVELERLWNTLADTRRFELLCAYGLDVFERAAQLMPLPDVCRLHTHVHPAADMDRFSRAVDGALEEVLGPAEVGKVYMLAADRESERVPLAELALMWVSANMPVLSERVLASARRRYAAAA
jgi:hypothetical protein